MLRASLENLKDTSSFLEQGHGRFLKDGHGFDCSYSCFFVKNPHVRNLHLNHKTNEKKINAYLDCLSIMWDKKLIHSLFFIVFEIEHSGLLTIKTKGPRE